MSDLGASLGHFFGTAQFITDPWFYAFAVPAVLITGISKGGFGGGLGILAVPLMAMVISPAQAAGIMLPILCAMDLVGIGSYRGQWSKPNLAILMPAAVVGVGVGGLTFRYLDDRVIELLIALIALGFLAYRIGVSHLTLKTTSPNRLWGAIAGIASGFTSTVAHAGGPPISIYLLPQRMDKAMLVATNVLLFTVINYVKLIPYAWNGQFASENLWTSALMLPLAPIGVRAGMWLQTRMSQTNFYRVSYAALAVSGAKLLWDSTFSQTGLLRGVLAGSF